jgi:hypothetical protein
MLEVARSSTAVGSPTMVHTNGSSSASRFGENRSRTGVARMPRSPAGSCSSAG